MKMKFSVIAGIVILFSFNSNAKINVATIKPNSRKPAALSEKSLVEELTGKKDIAATVSSNNLKKAPLPVQHFVAGKKAAEQKNYILAIKHFNTILKKYPQSAQVKPTLVAKATVYQEMGLNPQAKHNLQMAQQKKQIISPVGKTKQAMKTLEKQKVIK